MNAKTKAYVLFLIALFIFAALQSPILNNFLNISNDEKNSSFSLATTMTYADENVILFLPTWKNSSFVECDTVTIKIGVPYQGLLRLNYHLLVNITKPNGDTIYIDDYVRDYTDPHYYIEIKTALGENGSWQVSTRAEYKTGILWLTTWRYNNGTRNFTVSKLPMPTPEMYQITAVSSNIASPNFITIDEVGSSSTTLSVKVINQTLQAKKGIFTRFYVLDASNNTLWTDSGYTLDDGIITKTIPADTFFTEGDFRIETYISKDGTSLSNTTGVLHVRYVASPCLFPLFLNSTSNTTTFAFEDVFRINWTWNLYKQSPDTVECKIKLVDDSAITIYQKPIALTIISNGQNFITNLFQVSDLATLQETTCTVILETLSLGTHDYEVVLGNITISSINPNDDGDPQTPLFPEMIQVVMLLISIFGISAGILIISAYAVTKIYKKRPTKVGSPKKKFWAKYRKKKKKLHFTLTKS